MSGYSVVLPAILLEGPPVRRTSGQDRATRQCVGASGWSAAIASPPKAERARRGRPPPPPLNLRVELVLITGPEGEYLRQLQDEAILEVLRWFAEHRQQPPPDPDSHPSPDES